MQNILRSVFQLAVLAVSVSVYAQDHEDKRVVWLRDNAVEVKTIDPLLEGDDFSDLLPLIEYIGDAQVVGLGEQTHGDGATFHAKTRLIKFHHQKMGFDVLGGEQSPYI